MFWLVSTPSGIAGVPLVILYLTPAAVLWIVVATVKAARGGHLSPQPFRTRAGWSKLYFVLTPSGGPVARA